MNKHRNRDGATWRDRETDMQSDRETEMHRPRKRDRMIERERKKSERYRKTDMTETATARREMEGTGSQRDRQMVRQTYRETKRS